MNAHNKVKKKQLKIVRSVCERINSLAKKCTREPICCFATSHRRRERHTANETVRTHWNIHNRFIMYICCLDLGYASLVCTMYLTQTEHN